MGSATWSPSGAPRTSSRGAASTDGLREPVGDIAATSAAVASAGAVADPVETNQADTQGRDEVRFRRHTDQLWASSAKSWNVTGMPRCSKIRARSMDSLRDCLSLAPTSMYTPSGAVTGIVGRYSPGVFARSSFRSPPNRSPV